MQPGGLNIFRETPCLPLTFLSFIIRFKFSQIVK
jgi:hypothetical protein